MCALDFEAMDSAEYLVRMREALNLARRHHAIASIAEAIGVARQNLSTFGKGGSLGPARRAALEAWLREHGYWEVEDRGTHYLHHGEMVEPSGVEEPQGDPADIPVSEMVARWHEAQITMLRSRHLSEEQKKRLEGQWLKTYAQAWAELEEGI